MRHLDDDVPFGKLVVVLFFSAPPAGAGSVCFSERHPHVTLSRYCTIDMERRYILVVQNLGEAMKKPAKTQEESQMMTVMPPTLGEKFVLMGFCT